MCPIIADGLQTDSLIVTNSTISGNAAGDDGGAIFYCCDGTLSLTDTTISSNIATGDGGAIDHCCNTTIPVTNTMVKDNTAGARGGGIDTCCNNATITLTNSTFSGNVTSGEGGGFRNTGTLTVTGSTISDNRATGDGGGIWNSGTVTVTNSTFSGNASSGDGGGIWNDDTVTLTNSTFSGNATSGDGGGIHSFQGTADLTNTTFSGNSANYGGGVSNYESTATMINTIIAGNTSPNAPDCIGTLISLGHNLIGNNSACGFTVLSPGVGGDLLDIDPKLGPLQDNGGTTQTHALLSGSPAIDAGDDSVLGPLLNLATDQRGGGFPRLQGAHVDIGAYESAPGLGIPLTGDWNLVSLPIVGLQNVPVADVVALLGSNLTRVYCYDATNTANPWGVYDPAPLHPSPNPYSTSNRRRDAGSSWAQATPWFCRVRGCRWTTHPGRW